MKTILVPVDFSKYSEYALEVAAYIAKKQQSRIVLLHMMGLPESFLNKEEKDEVFDAIYFLKLTKKKFDKFIDKDYLKDLEIDTVVKNHKIFTQINEVALEHHADLIVMGSHGVNNFSEAFVGSNTEKVVRNAEVPVLVIKKPMKTFEIEKAVLVTDFDLKSRKAFFSALKFFAVFNIKPKLLFVNIPEKFNSSSELQEKATNFIADSNLDKNEFLGLVEYYDDYTTESGVFNYSNAHEVDIIAIPTHGRKGLSHFFYGSIGENVANHSEIPVVTFKM